MVTVWWDENSGFDLVVFRLWSNSNNWLTVTGGSPVLVNELCSSSPMVDDEN